MNELYILEYSEQQRLFHFSDVPELKLGWTVLDTLSFTDCISFCEFMDKKYVNGRVSGILPELGIVKIELELFLQLKTHRRKLAGRI